MSSILGGWLGTYAYARGAGRPPVRFEALFSRHVGGFAGSILDDAGYGDADVLNGVQSGVQVTFVKVYRAQVAGLVPIRYSGVLSDDGQQLNGTWELVTRFGAPERGSWEARRLWWDEDVQSTEAVEERTLATVE